MLAESMMALAAAGGGAIVQAAGTDAWATVRERIARLVGRGDAERQRAELTRLDQTSADLSALPGRDPEADAEAEHRRVRWESVWQTRLELLLEALAQDDRHRAAAELEAVVGLVRSAVPAGRTQTAGAGGLVVGGDLSVEAEGGSVAGGVVRVEGGVHLAAPFPGSRTGDTSRDQP
ncbi:hypothetical protein [Streptomyces paludis]|uniref:Uncharacterized protein n=1 Tax=Streptomyces paludis TaxID=2282738 RepID=A0A345HMG6_9ACTN|nr:hypothetical protein [Streptomyces paludis]AXG77890.1 hypothetical protein DVK44_09480 [Streptomyces paludis]